MKNKHLKPILVIGLIVIAALVTCAVAFHSRKEPAPVLRTKAPQHTDSAAYLQAVNDITASGNYRIHITTSKETAAKGRSFTETSEKTLTCVDSLGKNPQIQLEETTSHGDYTFSVLEQFRDGTAYVNLENGHFSVPITKDAYLEHQISPRLLDPALYGSVETQENGDRLVIGFSKPFEPESWAVPESAKILDASGNVVLDKESNFKSASYSVTCQQGDAEITLLVNTTLEPIENEHLPAPDSSISYVPISSLEIPRLLEHASGYLQQADTIRSQKQESIFCQVGHLRREQSTALSMEHRSKNPRIEMDTEVNLVDYNQGGTTKNTTQKEIFENGIYSITADGIPADGQSESDISQDTMILYAQNTLVGTVIMPEHIVGVTVEARDGSYLLTFQGSEELAQFIRAESCQILYQDPEILSSKASSYETETMECTLEIDAYTGFPLSSGIRYVGNHVIENTSNSLESTMEQTYDFLS